MFRRRWSRSRGWRASLVVAASVLGGCGDDAPAPAAPCGGAGVICRVAGTGVSSFNGDGKPAAETAFYLPSAVTRGPDDRMYVMDFNNLRLRRIDADGVVETVIGNGLHALAVDDVPATETPLENPVDFAFEPDDSLVFVSIHDPRVFRVGSDGLLTTIAGSGLLGDFGDGGDALGAAFFEIWGMAIGGDGSIYVADRLAHRVRVIHPDGTIDAFAGTGAAGYTGDGGPATEAALQNPEGLAVGDDGSVYVADSANHVVRRIDPAGTIETVAGDGSEGFSGDGGSALAAQLSRPTGITLRDGRLFVADTDNNAIRMVDHDGVVQTLVGTGEGGLAGDGGPATSAQVFGPSRVYVEPGKLWIADQRNSCVRAVELGI